MTNDQIPNDFPAFCRAHGLKCTVQRQTVFAALRSFLGHPSVDDIWTTVRQTVPTVTRESVYRILNEFAALGLISRLDALSAARYDLCVGPHAHFICEVCGRVTDYPLPKDFALPREMPKSPHHVELRVTGVCPVCACARQAHNHRIEDGD